VRPHRSAQTAEVAEVEPQETEALASFQVDPFFGRPGYGGAVDETAVEVPEGMSLYEEWVDTFFSRVERKFAWGQPAVRRVNP
jgi:hypothetical protein